MIKYIKMGIFNTTEYVRADTLYYVRADTLYYPCSVLFGMKATSHRITKQINIRNRKKFKLLDYSINRQYGNVAIRILIICNKTQYIVCTNICLKALQAILKKGGTR